MQWLFTMLVYKLDIPEGKFLPTLYQTKIDGYPVKLPSMSS